MKLSNVLQWPVNYTVTSPSTIARWGLNGVRGFAHKLLNTSSGWAFISYILLYLALVQYCSYAYYRDPTSVFFDPNRGYDRVYSTVRQNEATNFIQTTGSPPRVRQSYPPKLCIGIATIGRPGDQYVRSTVGSLLEGLTEKQRSDLYLTIFIAHTNPQDHPIFREEWLEVAADNVLLYNVSEEQTKQLKIWEEEKIYQKKAIFDYTYVLSSCHATGASWIAMIEDDTLAMAGWYPRAMEALDTADAQHYWGKKSDWLYLRLFYTEEFFGWNIEEWSRYLLASVAIISATAVSLFGIRMFGLHKVISNHMIFVVCFLCTPSCIILYFLAGRVSMQPLTPGVHQMPKFGCCAQGFVFSREMAPKITERLEMKKEGYVDVLLEEWAREEDLIRWAVVPSLLQHIGRHSSKGDDIGVHSKHNRSVAEKIWSFGFELHGADVV